MKKKSLAGENSVGLRRQAESRLRERQRNLRIRTSAPRSAAETERLLHELQVHQVELELQNDELQSAREKTEAALEKYSDLYDFAPIGYLSLDDKGRILEVNLTGATQLGVERSHLIGKRLLQFVVPANRPDFQNFLEQALAGAGEQVCEAEVLKGDRSTFWAGFNARFSGLTHPDLPGCRVSVSDLTVLKLKEDAQRRIATLAAANEAANQEIIRRAAVEAALRKSEAAQSLLLAEAKDLHAQLRHVARQILQVQEDERKSLSRELHDEVAQILAGINVQLAILNKVGPTHRREFQKRIAKAGKLVDQSIDVVHRFARQLRPALLDDLGLMPALHAFIRDLTRRRRLRVSVTAHADLSGLDASSSTVVYRVAQEALLNVVRHARARTATVRLVRLPNAVRLEVHDDGRSFAVSRVLKPGKYRRLGLLGMRERVEMVGGNLSIESTPGQGTTVRAQIPFVPKQRKPKS